MAKLQQNLHNMATRVQELEQYKLLCERRLLEFMPTHPLPIKAGHLGSGIGTAGKLGTTQRGRSSGERGQEQRLVHMEQRVAKLTAENERLRQELATRAGAPKDSKLAQSPTRGATDSPTQLRKQLEDLAQEKVAIEESLRTEMLAGEEQRNYIEILKEALETKIEDLGLTELIQQKAGTDSKSACDVFVKLATMKRELDDKRKSVAITEASSVLIRNRTPLPTWILWSLTSSGRTTI
jgi:hypothetical protein